MITERKKTHTQVHNDVKRILLVGWYFLFYSFHLFFVSQENVTPSLWLTFLFLEKCDRFNRLYKSALNLRRDLDGWPAHAAFIERQEKKRTKQNKTKVKNPNHKAGRKAIAQRISNDVLLGKCFFSPIPLRFNRVDGLISFNQKERPTRFDCRETSKHQTTAHYKRGIKNNELCRFIIDSSFNKAIARDWPTGRLASTVYRIVPDQSRLGRNSSFPPIGLRRHRY